MHNNRFCLPLKEIPGRKPAYNVLSTMLLLSTLEDIFSTIEGFLNTVEGVQYRRGGYHDKCGVLYIPHTCIVISPCDTEHEECGVAEHPPQVS